MVLFTHSVKKIKGATHENGYVDGTCKRVFTPYVDIILLHLAFLHVLQDGNVQPVPLTTTTFARHSNELRNDLIASK